MNYTQLRNDIEREIEREKEEREVNEYSRILNELGIEIYN